MKNVLFAAMMLLSFGATAQYKVTQLCGYTSPIVTKENVAVGALPTQIIIPDLDLVICDLISETWIEEGMMHTVWVSSSPTFKAKASRGEGFFRMTIDIDGCLIMIE